MKFFESALRFKIGNWDKNNKNYLEIVLIWKKRKAVVETKLF